MASVKMSMKPRNQEPFYQRTFEDFFPALFLYFKIQQEQLSTMAFPSNSSLMVLPSTDWDADFDLETDLEPFVELKDDAIHVFEQWHQHTPTKPATSTGSGNLQKTVVQEHRNIEMEQSPWPTLLSPVGPMEELDCVMDLNVLICNDAFLLPTLTMPGDTTEHDTTMDTSTDSLSLPFEERFEATAKNLAVSMKRSQETRKSLTVETPGMRKYERNLSVSGVVNSVEASTQKLQTCLPSEW